MTKEPIYWLPIFVCLLGFFVSNADPKLSSYLQTLSIIAALLIVAEKVKELGE